MKKFIVSCIALVLSLALCCAITGCNTNKTYNVIFDANGGVFYDGENSFELNDLPSDYKLNEPQSPTMQNNNFIGWSTEKYSNVFWDFENDTVNRNLTLYAMWQPVTWDINVQTFAENQKIINQKNLYNGSLTNSVTKTLTDEEVLQAKKNGDLNGIEYSEENIPSGKKVIYKKRTASYGLDDLAYYGANNNITYVGSLLKLNSAGTELSPIVGIKRKPLTLSIGLEGATGVNYQRKTVDTITQSAVGQAINELVQGFTGSQAQLPYMISMQLTEIKAQEEINAALGLSFNVGSYFDMSGEFDFSNKGEQTYAILTLKQVYYTVNADYNAEYGAFSLLDDGVTMKQISTACPKDACPVYVSSVSYGRIAAITIKTSKKINELRAALGLSENIMMTEGGLTAEINQINKIEDLQVNYFIYGGSIEGNQNALNCQSISEMLACLNQPYDPTKIVGMPISYQLSHIADNSSAKIGFVGEYYFAELVDANPTLTAGKVDFVSQTFNKELTIKDGYGEYYLNGAGYIANSDFLRVDISKVDMDYIKDSGSNIEIIITLSIKEQDDGYQEIYVYNAGVTAKNVQSGSDKPLAGVTVEHTVGSVNKNYATYTLRAIISPESVNKNEIWIAFDAYGKDNDTWMAKNITVSFGKTNEETHYMYATKN